MIERRLVIDPQDISHVEIACTKCGTVAVVDPAAERDLPKPRSSVLYAFAAGCPSCAQKIVSPVVDELRAFIKVLGDVRARSGGPSVRLVVKDIPPVTSTTS